MTLEVYFSGEMTYVKHNTEDKGQQASSWEMCSAIAVFPPIGPVTDVISQAELIDPMREPPWPPKITDVFSQEKKYGPDQVFMGLGGVLKLDFLD